MLRKGKICEEENKGFRQESLFENSLNGSGSWVWMHVRDLRLWWLKCVAVHHFGQIMVLIAWCAGKGGASSVSHVGMAVGEMFPTLEIHAKIGHDQY